MLTQAVLDKILDYGSVETAVGAARERGRKIVMVSGCFDLLHLGHMEFLSDAKALGDCLLVSVGSDQTVKTLKGKKRPIMPDAYRAQMLASLAVVDWVVIAQEPVILPSGIDFTELIGLVRPDIFAINSGNRSLEEKRVLVARAGGALEIIEGRPVTSTTEIISKIESIF